MKSETFVFAYGSNLDEERMRRRVPSSVPIGRSRLAGHDFRFHVRGTIDGTGKADAFSTGDPEHEVLGVVYRVVPAELPTLDEIEGGYRRLRHSLTLDEAHAPGPPTLDAWAYHSRPETVQADLLPLDWYLGHVLRGARAHGFPVGYVDRIRQLAGGIQPRAIP
ncbi:MAG: gamma-glutamylcyclotransferase [Gemmatimonadales bacterium]|nr:MAG: gamma-glutamylcyclotransferase [Gemmatimonadales bacterium]